jgi:hypothetical protein
MRLEGTHQAAAAGLAPALEQHTGMAGFGQAGHALGLGLE